MNLPKIKFAITYFSPVHPEMEICRRIEIAAKNLGNECHFIDLCGRSMQSGKHISEIGIDFVLIWDPAHITLFDTFVYHLLWFVPGLVPNEHALPYKVLSDNCDDHLSFPSKVALNFHKNCYETVNDNFLFPSVPKNYVLAPREKDGLVGKKYTAFYAGINLESKTVRHEKIFKYLDSRSLVSLYGPKKILGKKNWVGFSSYMGEIEFDGHSIMDTANKYGVTLALHHEVHASFSMPTNRLFEGIAAGTLVITDRMHFIEDTFGDSVFMLDSNLTEEEKAIEIEKILQWANDNPGKVKEKILLSQRIFFEKFELTKVLNDLCTRHAQRKDELLRMSVANCGHRPIAVVLEVFDSQSLKQQCDNIFRQDYDNICILAIIHNKLTNEGRELLQRLKERFELSEFDAIEDERYTDFKRFNILKLLREQLKSDVFCFCVPNQYWHHNHLRSLLESLIKTDSFVSYSGSYYLDESKKQIPILKNEILDFENKLFCTFCSERLHLCNLLQTELLKSSVMMRKEAIDLLQDNEIDFAYFYEHLVLILICYVNEKKITYSKKITTYLSDCPDFDKVEKDTQIYYRPLRNNWRMSYNSLQFVLNQVFAKNELVSSHLTKQRYSMGFDSHSFESKIGVGLLKFKRKIRKYHIIDSILAGFALLLSTISLIIFAI